MKELPEKDEWMNEWTCEWLMNELLDGLNGIPGNIISSFGRFVFKFLYILECTGSPLDIIKLTAVYTVLYSMLVGNKQLRWYFKNACLG